MILFRQGIDFILRILPSQTQPSQSIHILFARRKNKFMTIDSGSHIRKDPFDCVRGTHEYFTTCIMVSYDTIIIAAKFDKSIPILLISFLFCWELPIIIHPYPKKSIEVGMDL